MYHEVDFAIRHCSSREEVRKTLVLQFLEEEPGQGKGDLTSRYRYNVETLSDGKRVYLKRPAALNKGFDFTVHVENTYFKKLGGDLPTHDDIFTDLKEKKLSHPRLWRKLYRAIEAAHNLEDPDDIIANQGDILFGTGYPVDLLLKVIKWFFIEQDMTYWNWSGRQMFMNGVRSLDR